MIIESRAPTRVDLAGGTVDLWPLYLFLKNPITVNMGIDLWASARIEEVVSGSSTVILKSEDQKHETKLTWDDVLQGATVPPQLELHLKILRHFALRKGSRPTGQLVLSTQAKSPAGAGLGGSSTLSVAIIGAVSTWLNGGTPPDPLNEGEHLVEIVRDIETTVIQVPAGVQDYYGAMFGGLQALKWGTGSHEREWLPETTLRELEKRVLLFYSGQSRNSGINNWALFKDLIDNRGPLRDRFAAINAATQDLHRALLQNDWASAGKAIAAEWETRRTLAPGISTPEIDRAFEEARGAGAVAGKICGAGGGGCFFVYLPEASDELRSRVRSKVEALGIRPLPFRAVPRGLEVKVTRA